MHKRLLGAACLALMLFGCGAPEPAEPAASVEPTDQVADAPENSACEIGAFIDAAESAPGSALLFSSVQQDVAWGAGSAAVERVARRHAQRVRREGRELTAYVDGNQAWLGFEFVGDRLVEVRERHNNPNRAPPFVGGFLRSIVAAHGDPATVTEDSGGCRAVWSNDSGTVTALWRDSEWFVDVFYAPTPAALEGLSNVGERVGEWCDSAWPATIAIMQSDGTAYTLSMQFTRGGRATRDLVLRNGSYHNTEGDFGEYYRVGSGGELQLFDSEGFIRSASPGRCPS